ncbi:hypothetical protein [Brevundimonas sp.]|uniref:hypothetical protein n=1 Tax=Brevundimonas sp. TaxID=1871086 RepID=UPI002D44D33D|nr:hypothetical protein [Brevundimonas sp.]HYD26166.1 hypothetical protein [Brevundimonas sp.]
MRIYRVTVGVEGGSSRVIKVPSKTDVQAGDAAAPLMSEGEAILSIEETDDPYQEVDGPPPGTQTHPDQIV